jgi:hypothetical protein
MNVHGSLICDSPKLKATKWLNLLWYIHAILISNKEEPAIDIYVAK